MATKGHTGQALRVALTFNGGQTAEEKNIMENEKIEYNGLLIEIYQEEDAENPYHAWDMLTDVVTWMRSYEFSSKGAYCSFANGRGVSKFYDNPEEIGEALKSGELVYAAPLFAYIHSGITVNLGSMADMWPDKQWDCGLAGFVYVTKDAARREFPELFDKRGRARSLMAVKNACHKRAESEVEALDQWLTGDVWGYQITDSAGEYIGGCGWMYGYEYCLQYAKEAIDEHWKHHKADDEFDEGVRKWGDWQLDMLADDAA